MQNDDRNSSAGTAADSNTKDEITPVSQHSRKPPVVCSQMSVSVGDVIKLKVRDGILNLHTQGTIYHRIIRENLLPKDLIHFSDFQSE